jgi:uncharacterized protein YqeY
MLSDEIKKRAMAAMKAQDTITRDVLRLAQSEIQAAEGRAGKALADDEQAQIVRRLIKSNEETLALTTDAERKAALEKELDVLRALLPKGLDVDAIVAALASQADAIRAAKSDGQATGIAMKHLKSTGAVVTGADVGEAVKKLRA